VAAMTASFRVTRMFQGQGGLSETGAVEHGSGISGLVPVCTHARKAPRIPTAVNHKWNINSATRGSHLPTSTGTDN
jgi:hypothetical protein